MSLSSEGSWNWWQRWDCTHESPLVFLSCIVTSPCWAAMTHLRHDTRKTNTITIIITLLINHHNNVTIQHHRNSITILNTHQNIKSQHQITSNDNAKINTPPKQYHHTTVTTITSHHHQPPNHHTIPSRHQHTTPHHTIILHNPLRPYLPQQHCP